MRKNDTMSNPVERFNPTPENGLSSEQVKLRQEQKLINKTQLVVGKSNWEIIKTDILSFFNILLFCLGGFLIYSNIQLNNKWYDGIYFLVILFGNIVIGLFEDIKAKYLMKKMKIVSTPNVEVVRDGKKIQISPSEIVLDDILTFKNGEQITSDSIILEGEVYVDESMLTGESIDIHKKPGDIIYSGTYISSGSCIARADKVGKENYVETLSAKAKAFKRNPSVILKELRILFRGLGFVIISLAILIIITNAALGNLSSNAAFVDALIPMCSQFIAMIPAGLYLLTSFTLATGVLALHKKKANVQDLYSIEMLARADILCVDKTGTITDGSMNVKDIVPLSNISLEEIKNIIANIVRLTGDNNSTAQAIKNYCNNTEDMSADIVLPFNSVNKYSGATFSNGITYLLGAAEYLNIEKNAELAENIEKFSKKGLRVLTLVNGSGKFENNKFIGSSKAAAIIVLQDHVKDNAKETFAWFNNNHVSIKVISGDNAITVSEIAKEAGIANADKYISLEGMSIEEVKEIATKYTVFGRVSPEQKEAIVLALKDAGDTVAMTGDGVNDILALKRADCSIAMNSGASAAKNVSHIVLMNNDFSTMPEIVAEGRRVINNVSMTGSLFLTKTFFAIVLCVVFWIVSLATSNKYAYPYATNNLLVWEAFGFGLTAFFISLERNPSPIKKGFLKNVLAKAIPSALLIILGVAICYIAYALQAKGIMYTGVNEFGFRLGHAKEFRTGATAMSVVVFTGLSIVVLYNVCRPLSKYRLCIVIGSVIASALCFLIAAFDPKNLFKINFSTISNSNLVLIFGIILVCGYLIYYVDPITKVVKTFVLFVGRKIKNLFKVIFKKEEESHENK
ncbi:MAG: HAD-IC family P-type ATPase [Bacilli bacterium]|nr:HAD-IC family P-type ATPase [Bacilli bacterium]